jgi:Ca-activated chloride channel family protein
VAILWALVAIVVAVTVAVLVDWVRRPAPAPVRVTFVYTIDADSLLAAPIAQFNRAHVTVDGHQVIVTGVALSSGEAERGIERGSTRPDIWMPASSLWTELLNGHQGAPWVTNQPSFLHSPQVVAIWQPLARRLGWPDQPVRLNELLALAQTDPNYRFGHTNPDFSTSGITALIAEYAGASGHTAGGLHTANISDPATTGRVRRQEARIVHYGDTASAFLDQMAHYRQRYASWVITQEASLVRFNVDHAGVRPRLVAVYPSDGTYLADYPLTVMSPLAPWFDPLSQAAAVRFRRWLFDNVTPEQVAAQGFRSGPISQQALPPVDRRHGANPDPPAVIPLPPPAVINRIQHAWPLVRRPSDIGLVVDARCLLPDGGRSVEAGVNTLLDGFSGRDRVGLWTAEDTARERVAPDRLGRAEKKVRMQVSAITATPTTALFEAVAAARDGIAALPERNRLRGVIVLSDGRSDGSKMRLDELVSKLRQPAGADRVRVFAAACTPGADLELLRQMTYAAQGDAFEYDASDIGKVYRSLSSYY